MTFHSILFETIEESTMKEMPEAPVFLVDLNLDQIIETITAGREEYDLKPFFHASLNDIDTVKYRHEIMQDLENPVLFEKIKVFAQRMRTMRDCLAQIEKLYYKLQRQAWFLDAVENYCDTITSLAHDLTHVELESRGLLAFREYVTKYAEADGFASLLAETKRLKAGLSTVTYCILIKDGGFTVSKYESQSDYSTDVLETFEKFKQGAVTDYRVKFDSWPDMNHVEAKVLEFVAQLHPEIFSEVENFCSKSVDYLDETIAVFDREIQFYIAYLEYVAIFKRSGLKFSYPQVSNTSRDIYAYEAFDLALARKLMSENSSVVCNDFYLKGKERMIVVSGPNQGGKTTFARTFGQLHYLAGIGCPVPGRESQLFLFDRLFTHFEREESLKTLRGKLQDDLVRIHHILKHATSKSIVIMNEIFTSTTLQDAVFLSGKVMEEIIALDLLGVWVTFIDELAAFGEQTVSMVSTIVPDNPTQRTYKIMRRPADGLSYAMSIAEKHRVTYEYIKERVRQ